MVALSLMPLVAASASAVHPIRGWMSWERYTCETDCARFPDTCISERLFKSIADEMEAGGHVDGANPRPEAWLASVPH